MKRIVTKRRMLGLGVVGGLALLLISISLALAAGESIRLGTVGSGGGQISGGGLRLHSSIGQPAAGAVGDDLGLCSGYFCGPDASSAPSGGDDHIVYLPLVVRGN